MPTRNVLNVSDVDHFVDAFADQTDHPELKRWLTRNVRRWILKHYDRADRIARDPATGEFAVVDTNGRLQSFDGTVPAWCAAAIERGDEVVRLRLGATLRKRVGRAAAMLAAELQSGQLRNLERITFETAEKKAKAHRRLLYAKRRKSRVEKGTVPVFQAATGETVVVLTARESLADEGSRMAHCVATYDRWVESGESKIFSLRDRAGVPRATIEADHRGTVWQIKGFANGAVEPRYRPALQNFIRGYRYVVENDEASLLTVPEQLRSDPQKLESILVDRGGLAFLHANRFGGYWAIRDSRLDLLLRAIAATADQLSEPALAAVFAALRPGTHTYIRTRRIAVFPAYGLAISLFDVEMPLPLMYLVRQQVFKHRRSTHEAKAIYRAAEAAVVRLALAAPNRLFVLGPLCHGEPWENNLMECPADVLRRSRIDVVRLRNARHAELRQAMNKAQRMQIVQRSQPSKAHQAVRELLDGWRGLYVL